MGGHQEEDNGGKQWRNQLQPYGKWLCVEGGRDAGLVLLTHLTDPPQGFPKNDEYGVAVRAVARWSGVYKWLQEGGKCLWKEVSPSADALLDEFVEFLKEKDMTGEDPRGADFAAARLYLEGGAHARITKAMNIVRERAKKSMLSGWTGWPEKPPPLDSQQQEGEIYDWAKNSCGNDIGWGVWFVREDNEWFSQRTSYREGAFIYVGVTLYQNYRRQALSKASEIKTEEWGKDWCFPQSEEEASAQYAGIVKLRSLDDVLRDGRGFTEAFWSWLEPSIKQALDIIEMSEKG
ncbi:MAG: hypothetical protein ACE5H8_05660 [Alphaproteobacteria bacterium]